LILNTALLQVIALALDIALVNGKGKIPSPRVKTVPSIYLQVSISSTLKVQIFRTKIRFGSFYYIHVTWEKLPKGHSYKKFVCLMLMKLTPGVNFNNMLCTAFTCVDPKSVKRYWQLDWLLMLLGATRLKFDGEIDPKYFLSEVFFRFLICSYLSVITYIVKTKCTIVAAIHYWNSELANFTLQCSFTYWNVLQYNFPCLRSSNSYSHLLVNLNENKFSWMIFYFLQL